MRNLVCLLAFIYSSLVCAGPHTIQKGETFADVAELYGIPVDSIISANPDTDAYAGLTIEVPLSTLVYDLGSSELFRNMRYRCATNYKKGIKKYTAAHEKQLKLKKTSNKKRLELESQIINDYIKAVSYGNTDALYQLGRQKVHGVFYSNDGLPTFGQAVNPNLEEFQKGIEYLQIAAIIGKNRNAMVELALACGYEDSPIRNPYLCLGMLERYQNEYGLDVNNLICYMYENGYGIQTNLLQAYIYCPSTELTTKNGVKTRRERILEKIESMPINFESSRYGAGLDAKTMMSIGFSHYKNGMLGKEGIFWLHRAARLNDADANWVLASILQNRSFVKGSMGNSWNIEPQMLCFVKKAADNGKQEAKDFIEAYEKNEKIKKEQARREMLERRRQIEAKKARRRRMWANIAGSLLQTVANTYIAVESAKMQSQQTQGTMPYSMQKMPISQMTDAQWQAKNQLALQQIAQYTINKTYADWTGTPMVSTDMSAVDLGTDMTPGSPLWNWGMQQNISTLATQNARMSCEVSAFYKRQADQITQQLMENPLQPIAGYIDTNGNWISHEMVAADNDNQDKINAVKSKDRYDGFDEIRSNNEAYYAERYGNKECDFCHGTRNCPTCGGKGYNYNSFGVKGTHECPNCFKVNGRASGKCGRCKGNGYIYGLK